MKKMKKIIQLILLSIFCLLTTQAQTVYVDSNIGNNTNNGTIESPLYSIDKAVELLHENDNSVTTIKINSGIYTLNKPVYISTEKELNNRRIVIEANILPGDLAWTPEKMPVVISTSKKGDLKDMNFNFVAAFVIDESFVTIRGIKFPGYFYPNTRYFPIIRLNKEKTDLLVEQCLFIGDDEVSHLQVGIIAHGNGVRANHCIFYGARNSIVFWEDSSDGMKTGNGITNSIIVGASQSGVWTAWPDNDFIFENNIVSNCKHLWIKNASNKTEYSMNNCLVTNNQYYYGVAGQNGVVPGEFVLHETNVAKEGEVLLRKKASNTDASLPIDYLHVVPGSPGYEIGAGLFKTEKK